MIELRDVLIAAMAAGGAYAGVRLEIRHLWRAVGELKGRVMRVENRFMTGGK